MTVAYILWYYQVDYHTVVYHIRNTKNFDIQCELQGANHEKKTTTVVLTLPVVYEDKFEITYYYVAKEAESTGSRNTVASGISGKKYKENFLKKVKLEGSGYTEDGEYIQYNPTTGKYRIVSYPQTATGTDLKVGQTIAVDNTIIPRSGNGHRAKVYIVDVGYRQAEDAGSAIKGFHIDVYVGVGEPSPEPSWNKQYRNVQYFGNDLYNCLTNNVGNTETILIDALGVILPLISFIDILVNKNRMGSGEDKKTVWFYANKDYDREFDERADRNNYRT